MANEECLRKLSEGTSAWNEWRKKQPVNFRPELNDADLIEADLRSANLLRVDLSRANLSGADLRSVNLIGADLSSANLSGAFLEGANLVGANLSGTDLTGANLVGTNLGDAILRDATFHSAILRDAIFGNADLSGADLRRCRYVMLDGDIVRNARFSPNASDPWSVLRRTYTGMNFALILLALLAFVIPYVMSVAYWRGINQAQGIVESIFIWAENNPSDAPALLVDMAMDDLGLYRTPCLTADEADCRQLEVWQLLIGVHRGAWYWMLAIGLISYNALRYFITVNVGAFREEEERSGHAPSLKAGFWGLQGYYIYYRLHQIARILFVLSLISFGVHLWPSLRLAVFIPVGGN